MPDDTVYDIDDAKGVDDNLIALAAALEKIDAPLAAVLASRLSNWSLGEAPASEELLDALYAATALKEAPKQ